MSRLDRAPVSAAVRAVEPQPAAVGFDHLFAGGPRILVVDDNPCNLHMASELLACWGITPMLAADGAEAVALACGGDFDLILMDLQMPVLDGLEATKQIRRYELQQRCARAPVLAYTSCVFDEDILRHCGVDGVLEKPCSVGVLERCLSRWCAPKVGGSLEAQLPAALPSRR